MPFATFHPSLHPSIHWHLFLNAFLRRLSKHSQNTLQPHCSSPPNTRKNPEISGALDDWNIKKHITKKPTHTHLYIPTISVRYSLCKCWMCLACCCEYVMSTWIWSAIVVTGAKLKNFCRTEDVLASNALEVITLTGHYIMQKVYISKINKAALKSSDNTCRGVFIFKRFNASVHREAWMTWRKDDQVISWSAIEILEFIILEAHQHKYTFSKEVHTFIVFSSWVFIERPESSREVRPNSVNSTPLQTKPDTHNLRTGNECVF